MPVGSPSSGRSMPSKPLSPVPMSATSPQSMLLSLRLPRRPSPLRPSRPLRPSPLPLRAPRFDAIRDERFLVLPHPEVTTYFQRKATDYDRWLRGMRRFKARLFG